MRRKTNLPRVPRRRSRLRFLMPSFQYRALQADGVIAEGQIEAGGRQEAFRQIEERGLRPIRLAESNGNGARSAVAKKPASEPTTEPKPASLANLKLSFGSGTKVSARLLENFTR